MVVRKLSISVSGELEGALRGLASAREEDLSPLLEVLLREHWLVAARIQAERDKGGPDVALLGGAARRLWDERTATGELRSQDDDQRPA
ncbi:MAG: hypothetical protein HYT80_02120 [Euryarchaeota archaeon]|nr:hypothetical protein [Euryarchaeota archaeon]